MPKLSFQYVRQEAAETLLAFLTRRFRYHTPREWKELVEQGLLLVDGRRVSHRHVLQTREKIVYERPPFQEPEVDATFSIVFEDDHLLAVNKSGNIPTSPSGKYWDNCLVHVLKKELGLRALHAVHRLDRETSGLNLFAKTREAAARLGRQFQQGSVAKRYSSILRGHLTAREILLSAPLLGQPGGDVRIKQAVHPEGKASKTRFRLRAILPGASLVSVRPLTGRTHQIRAHAAFLGHPVWGDKLYGASEAEFLHWVARKDREFGTRQLLHATELELIHPMTEKPITLRSPDNVLLELFWAEGPPEVRTTGVERG